MIVYGRTHRLWIPSPVRLFPPFSPQFSPRCLRFPFLDLSQWSPNNCKISLSAVSVPYEIFLFKIYGRVNFLTNISIVQIILHNF